MTEMLKTPSGVGVGIPEGGGYTSGWVYDRPPGYGTRVRSASGWYASYLNAFLLGIDLNNVVKIKLCY